MRMLLDASIDAATLQDARRIIQCHPSVVRVLEVFGRNAGRYRFLEARVEVLVVREGGVDDALSAGARLLQR